MMRYIFIAALLTACVKYTPTKSYTFPKSQSFALAPETIQATVTAWLAESEFVITSQSASTITAESDLVKIQGTKVSGWDGRTATQYVADCGKLGAGGQMVVATRGQLSVTIVPGRDSSTVTVIFRPSLPDGSAFTCTSMGVVESSIFAAITDRAK